MIKILFIGIIIKIMVPKFQLQLLKFYLSKLTLKYIYPKYPSMSLAKMEFYCMLR